MPKDAVIKHHSFEGFLFIQKKLQAKGKKSDENHHMSVKTETELKKKIKNIYINIKLLWGLGNTCCKKENSTVRRANFWEHEEIQKNRRCQLIQYFPIAALLSLLFFQTAFPIELKVLYSEGRMLQYVIKAFEECFKMHLKHYIIYVFIQCMFRTCLWIFLAASYISLQLSSQKSERKCNYPPLPSLKLLKYIELLFVLTLYLANVLSHSTAQIQITEKN